MPIVHYRRPRSTFLPCPLPRPAFLKDHCLPRFVPVALVRCLDTGQQTGGVLLRQRQQDLRVSGSGRRLLRLFKELDIAQGDEPEGLEGLVCSDECMFGNVKVCSFQGIAVQSVSSTIE